MEFQHIEAAGEAPADEIRDVDYYAGARRITQGGVPCRVFQWRTREQSALIAAIEVAREAGAPVELEDVPTFSFMPAERGEGDERIAKASSSYSPKPSPMMKDYYKDGARVVVGGVPCRLARPLAKNHKPAQSWAPLTWSPISPSARNAKGDLMSWNERAAAWWEAGEEERAARAAAAAESPLDLEEAASVDEIQPALIDGLAPASPIEEIEPATPTGQIEPQAVAEPVEMPAEPIADVGAPLYRSVEEFRRAAVIGTRWRKSEWRDGAWHHGPETMVRTVARVQAREIAFAWGDVQPEEAERIGREARRNCSWLGFPKRGDWRSDDRGMIFLDREGQPRFRFDPLPALEPQEREVTIAAPVAAAEPAEALSGPEIASNAPTEGEADPIAEIMARLAALEAALATLPAQSDAAPTGTIEPTADARPAPELAKRRAAIIAEEQAARPKRTAAHERAIRRAWAERKKARNVMANAQSRIRHLQAQLAATRTNMEKWADEARLGRKGRGRRKAAAQRARRMLAAERNRAEAAEVMAADLQRIATAQANEGEEQRQEIARLQAAERAARIEAEEQRQRASVAESQLARIQRDMADPSQPERASDIARLVKERDQARTATAALQQRCERLQAAVDRGADAIATMGVRLANAEAAVRRMQAA